MTHEDNTLHGIVISTQDHVYLAFGANEFADRFRGRVQVTVQH